MKLTHDSFSDDDEYIFLVKYDAGDIHVEPGMIVAVGEAYYRVESVAGDTITARPFDA